jgi:hypothetical protein
MTPLHHILIGVVAGLLLAWLRESLINRSRPQAPAGQCSVTFPLTYLDPHSIETSTRRVRCGLPVGHHPAPCLVNPDDVRKSKALAYRPF